MNNVQILDCTLRDGGYCNEWHFGFENIKKITEGLAEANVEIIECGFLTQKVKYDINVTKYNSFQQISKIIPYNRKGKIFVAMVNYGEFDINDFPPCDGTSIDGIRIAFHKKNRYEALEFCKQIKEKGYLVFIQAMVSLSYTDEEFLEMIHLVNNFKPYAFYIVDSFGIMKGKDLTRLFYMVEHNLEECIWIGFHSHNNMQLAYSNAQKLTAIQTNRNLIIDSSIYGMGRGAGNLNTELFVEYLNENARKAYDIKPLLIIIDEVLNGFYQTNYWGYSLPNYISATHNAHPNYAGYLADKNTLTIEAMNGLFDMMDEEHKISFDADYIEDLYVHYLANERVQETHKEQLKNKLRESSVLLIAPGKSSFEDREKIQTFSKLNDIIVISVNFLYGEVEPDFIFVSNLRRFRELNENCKEICIITSNIQSEEIYYQTQYKDLLNSEDSVKDNAGLMAIRFLMDFGVKSIFLAGFDGYSHDLADNYGKSDMAIVAHNSYFDALNTGMMRVLNDYSKCVDIHFLTTEKFIHI